MTKQIVEPEVGTDASPGPITLASSGSDPIGIGIGAASGAAVSAALGTAVGGPVGAIIGSTIGAVTGVLAGRSAAEVVNPTLENSSRCPDDLGRDSAEWNRPSTE